MNNEQFAPVDFALKSKAPLELMALGLAVSAVAFFAFPLKLHSGQLPHPLPSIFNNYSLQIINAPAGVLPIDAWMSDSGLIAVAYQIPSTGLAGSALIQNSIWIDLHFENGEFSVTGQPTAAGKVGGAFAVSDPELVERGAIYSRGSYTVLPALPGLPDYNWNIYAMNEKGGIVGIAWDPKSDFSEGVLTDSALSIVQPLNASWAERLFPKAVNNQNSVIGIGLVRQTNGLASYSGFYLRKETIRKIDVPNSDQTYLLGLNERGDAVGAYNYTNDITRGLVMQGNRMWDFHIPGAAGDEVESLTENGCLCGFYEDAVGYHIFIAKPRH